MTTPAISVLLPARDAAPWLAEALRSLAAQTFPDFELIAVDDGSRDDTGALLAAAARGDRRVRVVPGAGRGIAHALNTGLEACRAPLIARMDADDLAHPRRMELQRALLASDPRLAAVGAAVELFPREGLSEGLLAYERWLNGLTTPETIERDCLVESPLVHPATMIRADALREAGGWRSEGWPEDYALWLELLARGWKLANAPEVLLRWRDHRDRLTRTHPDYAPEAHVRLKSHHLARARLPRRRCILWGAGRTGRAFFHALAAEGITIETVVDVAPARIGKTLYGVPIVGPHALGGFEGLHLVAAVGAKGARALIREHLRARGWVEVEQFSCVG